MDHPRAAASTWRNGPPDQWGGQRSDAVERFSSSVVALDLATGKVRWVFQTVHHDLWDYDVPAQPSLIDLTIAGRTVPALVTQPKSALSYEPPPLTDRDMWGATMDDGTQKGALPALNENFGAPFAAHLGPFTSPLGIPCQAPPWGYVAGADLTTGNIVWQHRKGTVRDLSPLALPFKMGVPNLGGPVITAGSVAFLSGSMDDYARRYDVSNGHQLWQARPQAGGQATPMTYMAAMGTSTCSSPPAVTVRPTRRPVTR